MRVLIVTNLYPPTVYGGYEILCEQVAGELARRGHDVSILTSAREEGASDLASTAIPHEGTAGERIFEQLQLTVPFRLPVRGRLRLRRAAVDRHNRTIAKRVIDSWRPDFVFVWSQLRLGGGPARAAQEAGVPTVFTFNDEHPTGLLSARSSVVGRRGVRGFVSRVLDTPFARQGIDRLDLSRTTCISATLKRKLIAGGLPIADSRVIFQGIPLGRFPAKESPGSVHEPIRLLYTGQLHPYKGVHTLVEAARILGDRSGVRYELTIAGAGGQDYLSRLERAAADSSTPTQLVGRFAHSAVPPLYRSHDIFVFPSIWDEPFGLTHLEAMASGTLVVATGHAGPGEFLVHEENALLFEKEQAGQLADQIARLAGDDSLRRRLALAARKTVEERFTLSSYVDRQIAWFRDLGLSE